MPIKDMTKEKYGKLTAIKVVSTNPTIWECRCDCGTVKNIRQSALSGGGTKSCGCSRYKRGAQINIVGNKYGKITVIEELKIHKKGQHIKYRCVCDCGNEKIIQGIHLVSGAIVSCGCRKAGAREDIIGKIYGRLTVVEELPSNHMENKPREKHICYKCDCSCGTKGHIVRGESLRSGATLSCGCLKSKGEEKIATLLSESNIQFLRQKTFSSFKSEEGRYFSYDFYISYDEHEYIIEFDGGQHFLYSQRGWCNEDKFKKTRKHDLIKNQYCFDNGIPIIRIPHSHFASLKIEDLLLDKSNFIISKENELLYFELHDRKESD